jgi:solute carrier family 25, member 38
VAGLSSGVLSAVLLQPADLLKTRVQQSGSSSLRTSFQEIWQGPNTIRSFWRGTLPSALRTGFGSALYFTSLNALRRNVEKSNLLKSIGVVEQGVGLTSSSLPKLSNLANLTTGAIARASAGFVLMPVTVIKVRYESGFGATAIRDAPYAGLYVLFYEQLKKQLSILTQRVPEPGNSDVGMKWSTSTSINFSSGVVAAGLATAITNPFDSIKTRIQLKPREYRNIVQAGRRMVREDGIKSLFDGLALRMSRKAISSALAWTLYEELIRRAEHTWKRSRSDELLNHP